MKRRLGREALAAVVLLALGGAVMVGAIQLRSLRPAARAAPATTGSPIPWLPTDAGYDRYAFDGSPLLMTASEAAIQVKKSVGGADPVLLPSAISASDQATVMTLPSRFSVGYLDSTAHEWLAMSLTYPVPPLLGPHGVVRQRSFRGVAASYGIDDPTDPQSYRYLMWNEPGKWDQSPDNILQTIAPTPAPVTGVPYALRATGMTESRFWDLANSIGPIAWPPTPPACRAADLRAAFPGFGNGAGGHILQTVVFVNRGTSACTLIGSPRMILLTNGGTPLDLTPTSSGFFPEGPASPVVLQPSSIEPSEATFAAAPAGQMALVNFELYYCDGRTPTSPGPLPQVTGIRVDLPGGGTLMAQVAHQPGTSRCDADGVYRTIHVSPFAVPGSMAVAQGVEAPPPLAAKIISPSTIRAGSQLKYQVELTNVSGAPYHFEQCPSYREAMDTVPRKQVLGLYRLNCAPVKTMSPGATVSFAMVIDVPATLAVGQQTLTWQLDVGSPSGAQANAAVRITA